MRKLALALALCAFSATAANAQWSGGGPSSSAATIGGSGLGGGPAVQMTSFGNGSLTIPRVAFTQSMLPAPTLLPVEVYRTVGSPVVETMPACHF